MVTRKGKEEEYDGIPFDCADLYRTGSALNMERAYIWGSIA